MSTFTFPVLGILLKQTINNVQTAPRCVAVLPGMAYPFPTHPTAHLPCDLLLPASGALLPHPLMGRQC